MSLFQKIRPESDSSTDPGFIKSKSLPKAPKGTVAYQIKPGESLGTIAERSQIKLQVLLDTNKQITDPNLIKAGDVIWIPKERVKTAASRGGTIRHKRDPLDEARTHLTDECWDKLESVCRDLKIGVVDLLTCILKETWGTFDPAKAGPGTAIGLIQFTRPAIEDRERRWNAKGHTRETLSAMTAAEQLEPVCDYLRYRLKSGRPLNASDIYMAILWPAAVGKADDTILMSKDSKNSQIARAYNSNQPLDSNGDGNITKAEASACVLEYRSIAIQLYSERRIARQR